MPNLIRMTRALKRGKFVAFALNCIATEYNEYYFHLLTNAAGKGAISIKFAPESPGGSVGKDIFLPIAAELQGDSRSTLANSGIELQSMD